VNKLDLRVYWIQNIPSKPKYYPVLDVDSGLELLHELARADLQNPLIISNVGGLEVYYPDWNDPDSPDDDGWWELETNGNGRDCLELICDEIGLSYTKENLHSYFGVENK
jgi:hypothetical protein